MKLMLDTDICIDIIRKRPRSVLDRLKDHAVGEIGISTVTLAELEYGASASSSPARNREALAQFVSPLEIAPFDRPATAVYGRVRAALARSGRMIGALDLLIAAHAISLGVRLVTHNSREFSRMPGLTIEDWH